MSFCRPFWDDGFDNIIIVMTPRASYCIRVEKRRGSLLMATHKTKIQKIKHTHQNNEGIFR
jgi:hypothetical protein